MANYFTEFSCILPVGTTENAETTHQIRDVLAAEIECENDTPLGFEMQTQPDSNPSVLWIHSNECGDPAHVIRLVQRYAKTFSLSGKWGFAWSYTCSRPMLDGFGGGAHVLDLETGEAIAHVDCNTFLEEHLALPRSERDRGTVE